MNTNVRKLNELENIIESIWNPDELISVTITSSPLDNKYKSHDIKIHIKIKGEYTNEHR